MKNFKVYKSSAGSGKTYTLVKEYLKIIVLDPSKIRDVLAITFTNAAAAQMKQRIINELVKISSLVDDASSEEKNRELLDEIIAELKNEGVAVPGYGDLVKNGGVALKRILHGYSDFSVSTIDSFVHRIIRSFAFDLQVAVNFEVEPDAKGLLRKAIDLVVSEVGSNKQLTKFMVNFIIRQANNEETLGIESLMENMANSLATEDSHGHLEKLKLVSLDGFMAIDQNINKRISALEIQISKKAAEAFDLIKGGSLPQEAFYQGGKGVYSYLKRLCSNDFSKMVPNKFVLLTIEEHKWFSGKATTAQTQSIELVKERLHASTTETIAMVEKHLQNYSLLKAVRQNIFPLGVLNEVHLAIDQIKRENALLLFSDFNQKISKIVSEQPVPFIYERVGERYKHYMIDEFQDTSVLQWQNLLPLVDNGLSLGKTSLVVGDGKQAIYRWRSGEVEQFVKLPRLLDQVNSPAKNHWQETLERNHNPRNLKKNWRSFETVIDFNNRFFTHASQFLEEGLQSIYDETIQETSGKKKGGYVEVRFFEKDDYQHLNLEAIIETIVALKRSGHPCSDIAILCRTNKTGSIIARHLLKNQIPVVSPDSLLINQAEDVLFVISLLKLVVNKKDSVAACQAINYLVSEKIVTNHHNIQSVLQNNNCFPQNKHSKNTRWTEIITDLLSENGFEFEFDRLNHLSVYDTCELIARSFFAGKEPRPFVNFFMDYLWEQSESKTQGFDDFIQWWEESSSNLSLVLPEGLNAVKVMTIHKSKGLEFPVVIFPFASVLKERLTKEGFWINPDGCPGLEGLPATFLKNSKGSLEQTAYYAEYEKEKAKTFLDNLNLLYVALTRAEEKLFVFSMQGDNHGEQTPQGLLHSFVQNETNSRIDETTNAYTWGTFENKKEGFKPSSGTETHINKFLSRSWSDALRVSSRQENNFAIATHFRERGNIFHKAMESIIKTSDILPVLDKMVESGEITAQTKADWEKKIRTLLSDERLAPCFAPEARVRTEAGLFDQYGNFIRPDRVVDLGDKLVVIDYKSGKKQQVHKQQVQKYADAMKQMGHQRVEKYLLYLDEPSLVQWD